MAVQNNPWYVENLDDFLYYCCPECDERNKSKEMFLIHAFKQHPTSKDYFGELQIKKELVEDEYLYEGETNITIHQSGAISWQCNVLTRPCCRTWRPARRFGDTPGLYTGG